MSKSFLVIKKFKFLIIIVLFLGALLLSLASLMFFLNNKFYPLISVAKTDISLLEESEATLKLNATIAKRLDRKINFTLKTASTSGEIQSFELTLNKDSFNLNIDKALTESFEYGHSKFYNTKQEIYLSGSPSDELKLQFQQIASLVNQNPVDSDLKIEDSQITATQSQEGQILDEETLSKIILDYINTDQISNTTLPVKTAYPKLSYEQALEIKKRLDQIKLSPLKLNFKELSYTLSLSQILEMINLEQSQPTLASVNFYDQRIILSDFKIGDENYSDIQLSLDQTKVSNYLDNIGRDIDQEVTEPVLTIDPASDPQKPRILEFQPPTEGRRLDKDKAYQRLTQALLTQNQTTVELPVSTVSPKNKLTNDLGIKELIGRGVSHFAGSIPNRIYNVNLTAQKLNGKLISPGEVFSFNNSIGDVSAANGYKQAYVIKSGRTVLDDGGGVCQDSTTLFRAALNAGLPIVKRTAHAYRVGYYEQGFPPGIDATIFTPSVDFQFKNDTPAHILIQAYTNGTTLYMDLYGTSDGRVSNLSKPIITNQIPAPPELRQDDPTLPKGTVKQVDFAAAGATVTFNRTVTRNGETLISESFKSVYRPWQAVFLVGTGG